MKNTFVALIPKNDSKTTVPADFRQISLTNEIYNIVARIIAAKLKEVMNKLINPCQSISHNVLLFHDLVGIFHRNKGHPRMYLKIDLNKAFDGADSSKVTMA